MRMNTNIFGTLSNWMMQIFFSSFRYFIWHQNSGMFNITIIPHHWHMYSFHWYQKSSLHLRFDVFSYHIKKLFVEIHNICMRVYVCKVVSLNKQCDNFYWHLQSNVTFANIFKFTVSFDIADILICWQQVFSNKIRIHSNLNKNKHCSH